MNDAEHLYESVAAVALTGLDPRQSDEGKSYVVQIVEDWLRQAGKEPAPLSDDLIESALSDLRKTLDGKTGHDRLTALQAMAIRPRVQKTSGEAFELAKRVADGKTAKGAAAAAASGLQQQIRALMQEVKAIEDEESRRRLMRDLTDGDLEARYVLDEEQGAVSLRLNRHIRR